MRSFDLRSVLALVLVLGGTACPGDDADDAGDDAVASTGDPNGSTGETPADTGPDASTGAPEATSTGAADESTGELVLGDIEVTVTYEGALTGTLNVVAITEFPPMGPPLAVASDEAPVFPWTGTLSGLEAGEYIIFATLDVGGDNPTIPGPEDPQAAAEMTVVVDGEGPFPVAITLTDPA